MASNKEKLIAVAQKLVEKGQFDKAVKEYLKVVQEDDKDARVWLKIGDLYVKQGRTKEAADAYMRVAQSYSDQGFYRKSVAVYKQIIKIEPRLVDVAQRLADLCRELGLTADALTHYEQVASFYQREGRVRDALPALKQMVELEPDNVASRVKLAELYSKEQLPKEAVAEFTRAAEYLKSHERSDDFMKVAERILFHTPENVALARELAGLYIQRGDARRALPKLQVCFKHDARDVTTLSLLASAFDALGQRDKTLSVWRELARIYDENGDKRRRDETWQRVLRIAPEDNEALTALGMKPAPAQVAAPPPEPVKTASVVAQAPQAQARRGASVMAPPPGRPTTQSNPTLSTQAAGGRALGSVSGPAPRPRNPMAPGPSFLEENGEDTTNTDPGGDEEIARILGETEVYRKYGLHAKAIEHLHRVFLHNPYHRGAREKLAALYGQLGRVDEAVTQYWSLYQEVGNTPQGETWLREIRRLRPDSAEVQAILDEMGTALPPPPAAAPQQARTVVAPIGVTGPILRTPEPEPEVEEMSAEADVEEIGDDAVEEIADSVVEFAEEEQSLPGTMQMPAAAAMQQQQQQQQQQQPQPSGREYEDRFGEDLDLAAAAPAFDAPGDMTMTASPSSGTLRFDSNAWMPDPVAPPSSVRNLAARGAMRPSLEDGLERAEYLMQQGFFREARAALAELLGRAPGHPLVLARLQDLDALELGAAARQQEGTMRGAIPVDEMTDEGADLDGGDFAGGGGGTAVEPLPREFGPPAMTERSLVVRVDHNALQDGRPSEGAPLPAEDYDTHYDLGIAYKEMGLLDDAIAEFRLVMRDPQREVECRMMVGLCFLEKGRVSEAISQFKSGLYATSIQEMEELALYYELGNAYERLGDSREALYYFEKVLKRDPHFRDIDRRIVALRGGSHSDAPLPPSDDIDEAFAGLTTEKSGRAK